MLITILIRRSFSTLKTHFDSKWKSLFMNRVQYDFMPREVLLHDQARTQLITEDPEVACT